MTMTIIELMERYNMSRQEAEAIFEEIFED